jgi:integrase
MAMGRNRSRHRAGWPDNLYPNRDGFKYRHPVTRKESWLGRDKARAFAAARKLNTILTPGDDLTARVLTPKETVADAIRVFRADDMPSRRWAAATAAVYISVLNRIESRFGDRELDKLSVKDCAQFIRAITESPRGRQQFRLVLGWVLACAVEEGWMDTNPALATRKHSHERKRERLTIESYRMIRDNAPEWLRNAMDLSLLTLLRREDVVLLRFADVRDGVLFVVPGKTENTSGVRLKIVLGDDAMALIARARDAVVSPYVIHRLPEKARPTDKRAKAREHHTQILPEQLSRAFADARDAAGITSDNPPTFHEIRSLGAALLRQSGWSEKQVQDLLTHTDAAMTKLYLAGHEQPWTEVSATGSLPR